MQNRLPRSTPEAQGIPSTALQNFIETVEKNIHELHSFMLVRHGQVVSEGWWKPYAPEHPHMLFSLSKSFTSSAIGLAVAEGRLTVEDKVIRFFPDDLPAEVSPLLAKMRVHDLLSMSTGHDVDATAKTLSSETWVKNFFEQPVIHEPGTHFVYNSAATFMLSAIIQKLMGMRLLDYLTPRLMEPLGIEGATWQQSPQGIDVGGWGLSIRTEDIACFGQMYLQGGVWNGQRLIAEEWVKTATSKQVNNDNGGNADWRQGYGYQFWRSQHNAYRGDGAFGQFCLVMPEQDAVIAITSGVGNMQSVLDAVWEHLLPAMQATALPADEAAHTQLVKTLNGLGFEPPQGNATSLIAARVSGKYYQIAPNDLDIKAISIEFGAEAFTGVISTDKGDQQFTGGYGRWVDGETRGDAYLSSGVWDDANTFTIMQRYYKTPFYCTYACHFDGEKITIDADMNVSFGPTHHELTGQAEKQQVQ
jgi:CubicO group peptidase (beta-lactamase class C family)